MFYILLTNPLFPVKVVYMSTVLYFSDFHGHLRPSLRTPKGSMNPRLRTYVLKGQFHQRSTQADLKSVKIQSSCQCLFVLLGSERVKATSKMLVKLTPRLKTQNGINFLQ